MVQTDNGYTTIQDATDEVGDVLETVFENGVILKEYSFQELRERAEIEFEIEELV